MMIILPGLIVALMLPGLALNETQILRYSSGAQA